MGCQLLIFVRQLLAGDPQPYFDIFLTSFGQLFDNFLTIVLTFFILRMIASCGNKYYGTNVISAVPTLLLIAPGLQTIQFLINYVRLQLYFVNFLKYCLTLFDTDLIGSFMLVTVGFVQQFSNVFKVYYRMIAMFQIKIIMLLSLLGSVAAGHRTIRFLLTFNHYLGQISFDMIPMSFM
jgi:hypothetical protein